MLESFPRRGGAGFGALPAAEPQRGLGRAEQAPAQPVIAQDEVGHLDSGVDGLV